MTIRSIQFNASDFEAGTQYRTKDGKLVTLKHVCVENDQPRVSLEGLQVGDQFRVRSGEVFTCDETDETDQLVHATSTEYPAGLWFLSDGRSNLLRAEHEVIELLRPSVLEQIRRAIKSLRTEDISVLVVTEGLWRRAQEEAGVVGKTGMDGLIFVEGVKLWYDPVELNEDTLKIELKLR